IQEEVWIRDHEMGFEGQRSQLSKRLHDRGSHRNVGHEMAVHDVDVNAVGTCLNRLVNLCRKMAEVRGENGWCEFSRGVGPSRTPFPAFENAAELLVASRDLGDGSLPGELTGTPIDHRVPEGGPSDCEANESRYR